jgi:hypothetical protein
MWNGGPHSGGHGAAFPPGKAADFALREGACRPDSTQLEQSPARGSHHLARVSASRTLISL